MSNQKLYTHWVAQAPTLLRRLNFHSGCRKGSPLTLRLQINMAIHLFDEFMVLRCILVSQSMPNKFNTQSVGEMQFIDRCRAARLVFWSR
jgi:hypothetical protein